MTTDTQLAPTDAELTAIYRAANGEDTGKAQPLTTQRIFRAMRAAIDKWGQPAHSGEPVAWYEYNGDLDAWFLAYSHNPKAKTRLLVFGDAVPRAIEAEVRKEDEALIRQLVDALEQSQPYVESCANGKRVQGWGEQLDRAQDAINAARSRLEQPCA